MELLFIYEHCHCPNVEDWLLSKRPSWKLHSVFSLIILSHGAWKAEWPAFLPPKSAVEVMELVLSFSLSDSSCMCLSIEAKGLLGKGLWITEHGRCVNVGVFSFGYYFGTKKNRVFKILRWPGLSMQQFFKRNCHGKVHPVKAKGGQISAKSSQNLPFHPLAVFIPPPCSDSNLQTLIYWDFTEGGQTVKLVSCLLCCLL